MIRPLIQSTGPRASRAVNRREIPRRHHQTKNPPNGGLSSVWWTRTRRIRTAASIPVKIPIAETWEPPLYQRIAGKAKHLRDLGMTYPEIGLKLGVDRWTVGKAVRWS